MSGGRPRDGIVAVGQAAREMIGRALDAGVSGTEAKVLLVIISELATYSRLEDYLATSRILALTGIDKRRARRALRALADAGVIGLVPGSSPAGGHRVAARVSLVPSTTTGVNAIPGGIDTRSKPSPVEPAPDADDPTDSRRGPLETPTGVSGDTDRGLQRPTSEEVSEKSSEERAATPSLRSAAQAVFDPWWESQTPRPAQSYISALKVIQNALSAGWTSDEIATALPEIPSVSGGCLDFWRNQRRTKSRLTETDVAAVAADSEHRLKHLLGAPA